MLCCVDFAAEMTFGANNLGGTIPHEMIGYLTKLGKHPVYRYSRFFSQQKSDELSLLC